MVKSVSVDLQSHRSIWQKAPQDLEFLRHRLDAQCSGDHMENPAYELCEIDGWFVARSLQSNLASQGNTKEEAITNLEEALELDLEYPQATLRPTIAVLTDCPPLTGLTFRQIRFKLENAGFSEVRQKGNHAKFVNREAGLIRTAILPHYIQIAPPVLQSVVHQSGIELREFMDNL